MPHGTEWTVATLHEHIESLLKEMDKRNEQRFSAQESAIAIQLASQDRASSIMAVAAKEWRDQSNEWRGTVNDVITLAMPRTEFDRELRSMTEKVSALATGVDGKISTLSVTTDGKVAALIAQISSITAAKTSENRMSQSAWGYVIAAIMAGIAIFFGMRK